MQGKSNSQRFHYGWIVLGMGTLETFVAVGMARFGYTTVLPAMQMDLGMDNGQAGLLATFNLVGYLALAIIGGVLASRYGARIVATCGLILAGAGMIFTGVSHGFLPVALWRALTGVGCGATNIAIMGLWTAWFSSRRRGLASGIAASGSSIGLIFNGLLTPWILDVYGISSWRICWLLFGSITLLMAVASYIILRNSPFDINLSPVGEDSKFTNVCAPAQNSQETFQWKRVYGSALVWRLGLVYAMCGFSYIIYMTFYVKSLIAEAGYTQVAAGRLSMTMGWFSLICGLLWGTVSDRIGRKNTLIILFLIHSAAYFLFAVGHTPFWYLLSVSIFGLCAWSIPAIMAAACGDALGPKLASAALGFITLFFGVGQALGPLVAGEIADALGSFRPTFLLAAAVAFIGAAGSLLLGSGKQDPAKNSN